jgi:hypothetical protein
MESKWAKYQAEPDQTRPGWCLPMRKTDSRLRETLGAVLEHALSHIENLDNSPVAATADLSTLRRRLGKPLAAEGIPAEQVIEELVRDVDGGILGSAGGRFFGWVVGASVPAALAADWLTSAWDQNGALYATAPAAAVVEEVVGAWLKDILGLPPEASLLVLATRCWQNVAGMLSGKVCTERLRFGFCRALCCTVRLSARSGCSALGFRR